MKQRAQHLGIWNDLMDLGGINPRNTLALDLALPATGPWISTLQGPTPGHLMMEPSPSGLSIDSSWFRTRKPLPGKASTSQARLKGIPSGILPVVTSLQSVLKSGVAVKLHLNTLSKLGTKSWCMPCRPSLCLNWRSTEDSTSHRDGLVSVTSAMLPATRKVTIRNDTAMSP